MAKFVYRARNFSGEMVRGEVEAPELTQAKKIVSQLKLIVLEINEGAEIATAAEGKAARSASASLSSLLAKIGLGPRVKVEDVMMFFQQTQTIYAVGIPINEGLQLVAEQCESPYLKSKIEKIVADISQGRSMSEAFGRHPDVFDSVTVNLIRAGEMAGQMEEILERISVLYQQRIDQTAKVKSAVFYPKIVIGMMAVVFVAVVYFVIPKFKAFFDKFGGELPLITRLMLGTSDFFVDYWYLIGAFVFGCIYAFRTYTSTPHGIRQLHGLILKLPYFGSLFLQNDMVAFCGILEMLVKSGITITKSLEIVKGALANVLFQDDIEKIASGIESGHSLREGMIKSPVIPKVASNLIGIGEEAGALEKALNRLGVYYKLQVEYKLNNMSKAIEPILLVFIFGMVLALSLAVFLPMWKMNSMVKK